MCVIPVVNLRNVYFCIFSHWRDARRFLKVTCYDFPRLTSWTSGCAMLPLTNIKDLSLPVHHVPPPPPKKSILLSGCKLAEGWIPAVSCQSLTKGCWAFSYMKAPWSTTEGFLGKSIEAGLKWMPVFFNLVFFGIKEEDTLQSKGGGECQDYSKCDWTRETACGWWAYDHQVTDGCSQQRPDVSAH